MTLASVQLGESTQYSTHNLAQDNASVLVCLGPTAFLPALEAET